MTMNFLLDGIVFETPRPGLLTAANLAVCWELLVWCGMVWDGMSWHGVVEVGLGP